ncbi:MAG: hypothetical protein MN733_25905 [Nitrososphaera sp.]|nr:hypothetical protein [Nitrososphaera sp.]
MVPFTTPGAAQEFLYWEQFAKWGIGDCSFIVCGHRASFIVETCTVVESTVYRQVKAAIRSRLKQASQN